MESKITKWDMNGIFYQQTFNCGLIINVLNQVSDQASRFGTMAGHCLYKDSAENQHDISLTSRALFCRYQVCSKFKASSTT